jgi:hypothetical protein
MSLCQIDGSIYNDTVLHNIILKNKSKEMECKCCSQCWGIMNIKYQLGKENNIFIVPDDDVVKVFKISSVNFEFKPEKNKPESKIITDVLKLMKDSKRKKS